MIQLPSSKIPESTQDPKKLIIYGCPKVGKTSLLSTLDNCLLVDLENGSDYVSALKIKINTVAEFFEMCKEIEDAGKPYKFAAIDTLTALEDFAKPLALALYKNTAAGSTFDGTNVLEAPNGAGYGALRDAIERIINRLSSVVDNIIMVGHIKDKNVVTASDSEIGNVKELDMSGKTPRVLCSKSDAIGFIYRDKESNLCVNFKTNGEATAGARPKHLANKQIIVAERQEDGSFVSHWDRIYPSLSNKDKK